MQLGVAASQIDVIATTPLAGGDHSLCEIPAPIQTASQQDIDASRALDLSDLLNRRLSGVNINENQKNPFIIRGEQQGEVRRYSNTTACVRFIGGQCLARLAASTTSA
jgi:outer membrane receptor for ferrienterochelin and colicin